MRTALDVLKELRPTSIPFLLGVLAVGVALAFGRRTRSIGRWYFLAALLAFWVFSTPACVEPLVAWRARDFGPLTRAADARGATTVVVLGGGNRAWRIGDLTINVVAGSTGFRVIEGARLYRLLDRPTILLCGGGAGRDPAAAPESDAMRDAIVQLGVPRDRLVLERESQTTGEEALSVRRMLEGRQRQPIVLVTSPTHMRRALVMFGAAGLNPVPSASAYQSDRALERRRWLPSDTALMLFDSLVYDTAAELYYLRLGAVSRGAASGAP
jgi:uncharacterized SAM-binding protein YcdF (DUF218 family)